MKRIATLLAVVLSVASCANAYGQGAVLQSGIVTSGHGVQWLSNGVIGDTGQSATGATPCPSYPCTFTGLVNMTGAGTGLAVTNNMSVGGTLTTAGFAATGASTLTGLLTANGGANVTALAANTVTVTGLLTTNIDADIHGITVGLGGNGVTSNTAVGFNALIANTTGFNNTALGNGALALVTAGSDNTALGAFALSSLTSSSPSSGNTGVGAVALQLLTTGTGNTAVGLAAGSSVTTGDANVAIGLQSLQTVNGSANVAIGYQAMSGGTSATGSSNVAVGYNTLPVITGGIENVALGHTVLSALTTGGGNVAIGNGAGAGIITGGNNIFLGALAGVAAGDGSDNVVIGGDVASDLSGHSNYIALSDGASNRRLTIDNSGNWTIPAGNVSLTLGSVTAKAGIAPAGGFALSPRNVNTCGTGGNAASGAFTDQTPVSTEFYVAEVMVPANVTVTGVAVFNGSVASGNMKVGLANSSGVNVATSASTAVSGTSAYQRVAFTGTYAAVGPATYYVEVFYDNNTTRANAFTVGNCGVSKATGQTFATGFTTVTPPTTFSTALGPVAALY